MSDLSEWDWVVGAEDLLHHMNTDDWDDETGGPGVTTCGLSYDWWCIPGIFTRMGAMRCEQCCDALGYPHGKGSPKNDDACRPLVEARIAFADPQEAT